VTCELSKELASERRYERKTETVLAM
jgi:hypothetical protein